MGTSRQTGSPEPGTEPQSGRASSSTATGPWRPTATHYLVATALSFVLVALLVAWLSAGTLEKMSLAVDDGQQWLVASDTVAAIREDADFVVTATLERVVLGEGPGIDSGIVLNSIALNIADVQEAFDEGRGTTGGTSHDQALGTIGRALQRSRVSLEDLSVVAVLTERALEAGDADDVREHTEDLIAVYEDVVADLGALERAIDAVNANGLASIESRIEYQFWLTVLAGLPVSLMVLISLTFIHRSNKAERALRSEMEQGRSQLQSIVDCLPLGVVWKDARRRAMGANDHFTRSRYGDSLSKETAEAEDEAMRSSTSTGAELVLETGEGRRIVRQISAPIDTAEEHLGVVTALIDVTDELELRRALEAARRMESVGELASGIAHEINTPLQFVSDNTSFLATAFHDVLEVVARLVEQSGDPSATATTLRSADMDFLKEELPAALAQSQEGLARVRKIVAAMKDFAHPGGDVGPCDLNSVIESTVVLCRHEWKAVAELELDLDPGLPEIRADGGQVNQAILNLVVNASHAIASKDGGGLGTITVATSSDGHEVIVSVRDDGTGMSARVKERAFERFFTTKPVGTGTGQGLSLVWDVMRGHGGRVELESTEGVGTEFTLRFPIAAPASSADPSESSASVQPTPSELVAASTAQ